MVDGLDVEEFIIRNADPIWLHQNELWEYIRVEDHEGSVAPLVGYEDPDDDTEIPF